MKKDNLTEQIEEYMATQEKPEEMDEGYGKETENSFSRCLMDAVCECLIAVAILVLSVWVGLKRILQIKLLQTLQQNKKN